MYLKKTDFPLDDSQRLILNDSLDIKYYIEVIDDIVPYYISTVARIISEKDIEMSSNLLVICASKMVEKCCSFDIPNLIRVFSRYNVNYRNDILENNFETILKNCSNLIMSRLAMELFEHDTKKKTSLLENNIESIIDKCHSYNRLSLSRVLSLYDKENRTDFRLKNKYYGCKKKLSVINNYIEIKKYVNDCIFRSRGI
ncbi:MAG: hypothetical protein JJV93_03160 [Alphaproteobacteria bacterium]|nr:hypothetical protein [Alphaproteobacteria bacterium]